MRIGTGYDSHRFSAGRRLILGGLKIPYKMGLLGHSDGDVLVHAIIDSIIGAAGMGDIGRHFPDTDPRWKDASSIEMLSDTIGAVGERGYGIVNIDSTIITEEPRLSPYIPDMIDIISKTGIPEGALNIKAKTNEGMGFIGRGEGVVAISVALLYSCR
ncbi:2-C-methyl-D-erythritol 2,4-cyclodiphosphate synthase [bacterium BMS3Bbin06]|nr:2-C-methyl-D-erythritol 2,4-cyclodiphosphate synthase [bacterium BMS3Abin08]GBE34002.1 2-C-methyl-D-erythritol 2,4-cyclodiphosphate synthase [bacterium BMS3Bbin06]HDO36012.1 2-C-methyl-D-erythritol 2,4-cyclodiphosphate synthase [Nitrospirota bacterium]